MLRITTLIPLLLVSLCSVAQINRPRSTPSATTPSPSRGVTPSGDGPIAVTNAYDVDIKLLQVQGNAASQQVALTLLFNNPKANQTIYFGNTYAIDSEGNEYKDAARSSGNALLFTDIPRKDDRTIAGVPSKIALFKLLKIDFSTSVNRKKDNG